MPRITYSTAAEREITRPRRESTSHLTAVAVVIGALFLIVSTILWYRLATHKQPPTTAEVATQILGGTKPYDVRDGLRLCGSRIPTIGSSDEQDKRQECYHAVMVLFGDSSFCDSPSLDADSSVICRRAARFYSSTMPGQSGSGATSDTSDNKQAPATEGNVNSSGGAAPGSGSDRRSGAGTGSTSSGNTNNATTGANGNSNGNTNSRGGDQLSGNVNGNVNNTSGNTNSNSNTNGNVGNTSQNTNGNTNGNSNGNVNGNVGNTNTNTNGNTNGNVNSNTNTSDSLCTNEAGEIILLQHSNQCQ